MEIRKFKDTDYEYIKNSWINTDRLRGIEFPADYDEYIALTEKWNSGKYNGKYFDQFVISDGSELTGVASLYEQTENSASIGVIIDKNHYRKGYCSFACNELVKLAKDRGFDTICAGVAENNLPSLEFCKKFGFTEVGRIVNTKGRKQVQFVKKINKD